MTPSEIAARFDGKPCPDGWMAHCPGPMHKHGDRNPSLHISTGRAGDVVLYCHAGCASDDVLSAKGLTPRDLFVESGRTIAARKPVAVYPYVDPDSTPPGQVAYRITKTDPKGYYVQHQEASGEWVTGLNGNKPILFHLPELRAAIKAGEPVWIVEGEKDVETLRARAHVATTNPFGAGKWRNTFNKEFRGARVGIVADNDEPGLAHAQAVQQALYGIAAKVTVLRCTKGKDITDHLAAGGKLTELEAVAPAGAAPLPVPAPEQFAPLVPSGDRDGFISIGTLLAEPDNPTPWVVDGLIPSSGLALIAGKPKAGKSTLARAIALQVARGAMVLGRLTLKGPVLYLGLEDPREVIKGHFRRMGATPDDALTIYPGRQPDDSIAWLAANLDSRKPVLVVIDTMQFFLGIKEINEYGETVNALRLILDILRPRQTAGLIVHHAGKGDRTGFDAVLGSTGIMGTVDCGMLVKRRDDARTLQSQQRMHAPGGEDMPESVLSLDPSGMPQLVGTRADFDLHTMCTELRVNIPTEPGTVDGPTLRESVEGRGDLKVKALAELHRTGQVLRLGKGQKGDPFLYSLPRNAFPENTHREASLSLAPETNPAAHQMPKCVSRPTVGNAETHREIATSLRNDGTNAFPGFPSLGTPGENPGKRIPGSHGDACDCPECLSGVSA